MLRHLYVEYWLDREVDEDARVLSGGAVALAFALVEFVGLSLRHVGKWRAVVDNRRCDVPQGQDDPLAWSLVEVVVEDGSSDANLIAHKQRLVGVVELDRRAHHLTASLHNSELDGPIGSGRTVCFALSEHAKVLLAVHLQLLRLDHEEQVPIDLVVDNRDVSQLMNVLQFAVLPKLLGVAVLPHGLEQILLCAVVQREELSIQLSTRRVYLEEVFHYDVALLFELEI